MPRLRPSLLTPLLAWAAACTGGSQTGPVPSDSKLLTRSEILSVSDAHNALDVIRRLRPTWLHARTSPRLIGAQERADPVVYVDAVRYGPVGSLASLSVQFLGEVRFLSGPEATQRFGTGHTGGAILVTTGS